MYLEKQKKNISKNKYFLSRCQYKNKKLFSEGFEQDSLSGPIGTDWLLCFLEGKS